MEGFVQRQIQDLMVAINDGNSSAVQELFDGGGVHVKMADSIIRAAFGGDVKVTRVWKRGVGDTDIRSMVLER